MGNPQTNNVSDEKEQNLDAIMDLLREIASNEDEWNKASENPSEYVRQRGYPTLPGTDIFLIEATSYPIGQHLELREKPCRPGWLLIHTKMQIWGCVKLAEVSVTVSGPNGERIEIQTFTRCIQEGWIEVDTIQCVPRNYIFSTGKPVIIAG